MATCPTTAPEGVRPGRPMRSRSTSVDDADTALTTIVDLGGSVIEPPEDTPYGRLAHAADPTGAQFKLVASP